MNKVTIEQAVEVCRKVEALISPHGAHCALTGSCLYKGESKKDIDIIIYSHQLSEKYPKEKVLEAIKPHVSQHDFGFDHLGDGEHFFQTNTKYIDKDVVLCVIDGFRIDLFFMP